MSIEHAIDSPDLKLDYPHESWPILGLKIPHEERCSQVWSAFPIDEAHIGTRRYL
jgi:hypothetical protein